jgi:hypothetical protein
MHCALLALPAFWQASMLAYLQLSVAGSIGRQNLDLPTTLLIIGFGDPTGATWLCDCAFATEMPPISAAAAAKVVNVLMSLLLE